jgi:hypothetical protein
MTDVFTTSHGRKNGIVHELRCIPLDESDFVVGLRCEKEKLFGAMYGRGEMPLYGPSQVTLVDDPIDCMACIAGRCL